MPKLLVVDDEIDIREFAKNFFAKRGIPVLTAGGGVEALQIIQNEKPDLVLLDVTMDELSGLDVLRRLRKNNNNVKVIMVTGVEDEDVVQQAHSFGVRSYIHKPLILEELEKIVLAEINQA
ncbi:MAG: response regulator [Candidatus Omnitrophica bacterium]|nr:response regulator [Candidatus Omnitrophota bacterium]